jgi:ArsR family transcriptional regulator
MDPTPARAFKTAAYTQLAALGRALGSPARVELLELLAQAPRSVEALAVSTGQSVANTSQHLQVLRRAGLAHARRDGQHMVYTLAGPAVGRLLGQLHAVGAAHDPTLRELTRAFFDDPAGLEPLDAAALAARLCAGEAILIDVRPEREFAAGHLPGARSVPLALLEARLDSLPRDRTIVAYCRGPFCTFSAEAVQRLRALGFDARRADVSVQAGGLGALPA